MKHIIQSRISESIETKQKLLNNEALLATIENVTQAVIKAFQAGNKVLFCGNGGSAADAQHLAPNLAVAFI